VLVPRHPGLASAFGQLRVEIRDDYQRALLRKHLDIQAAELERVFSELEEHARDSLLREGVPEHEITLQRTVDLKYYPQTTYLNFPFPDGEVTQEGIDAAVAAFLERHEQEFGYSVPLEFTSVEFVNARLTALGPAPVGELQPEQGSWTAEGARKATRQVHFAETGGWADTAVYDRDRLGPGAAFAGPAIVEQPDSTTVVPPGADVAVDQFGNLTIDVRRMPRL
jgi:N-methylhydantoinase A